MSSFHGNGERCPGCGVRYGDFRTGYAYRDVYQMIWDRPHKRRNGVLGAWHELKQTLWKDHVDGCSGPLLDPPQLPAEEFRA